MQSTDPIDKAINHLVLAAKLRMRELEVRSRCDHGDWHNEAHQNEHARLAIALKTLLERLGYDPR